ncbi:hypothetical protein [Sulfurimonas sp.]
MNETTQKNSEGTQVNHSIVKQAKRQGADHVIHKLDVEDLQRQIKKFARI